MPASELQGGLPCPAPHLPLRSLPDPSCKPGSAEHGLRGRCNQSPTTCLSLSGKGPQASSATGSQHGGRQSLGFWLEPQPQAPPAGCGSGGLRQTQGSFVCGRLRASEFLHFLHLRMKTWGTERLCGCPRPHRQRAAEPSLGSRVPAQFLWSSPGSCLCPGRRQDEWQSHTGSGWIPAHTPPCGATLGVTSLRINLFFFEMGKMWLTSQYYFAVPGT